MAILSDVKAALRISVSTTSFDSEVVDLIDAARDDLRLAGTIESKVNDDGDPLIKRAITTYCKANFGYDNGDAERFQKSYDMLKMHLTLSQEYTAEPPAVSP
ncbi:DNA-packaging protein [Paenibacillus sp. FSL H8-0548]|uniref:head-tail connector protein n=1 Tax=Paenibacillus sp. FSL H8-0548 TaxID=1920422 RepID=UPI00096DE0AA|nr:head-tail connector protein [Paenibacillus sp. FSL H8-0548]OMF35267.1 DNA-packaging protein [Paenibacillus sp. FSL H8-0548]